MTTTKTMTARKMTRTFDTAIVKLPEATIMLVAIPAMAQEDTRLQDTISRSFERASGYPVVLLLSKPCGCETVIGPRAYLRPVAALPPHAMIWQRVAIDLNSPRPVLRVRPGPVRSPISN